MVGTEYGYKNETSVLSFSSIASMQQQISQHPLRRLEVRSEYSRGGVNKFTTIFEIVKHRK